MENSLLELNKSIYFLKGEQNFKRPAMGIDKERYFRTLHKVKPKYAGSLRNFVQEHWTRYRFDGKRTVNVCWYDTSQLETPKIIIWETLELVQDMDFAKEHFSSKKKE